MGGYNPLFKVLVISGWKLSTPLVSCWRQTECDLLTKITGTGCPTSEQARWRKVLSAFHLESISWTQTNQQLLTETSPSAEAALNYGQSKHNLSAEPLSLSPDSKQTLLLSDLLPEQLFSFYCSPRTAPWTRRFSRLSVEGWGVSQCFPVCQSTVWKEEYWSRTSSKPPPPNHKELPRKLLIPQLLLLPSSLKFFLSGKILSKQNLTRRQS